MGPNFHRIGCQERCWQPSFIGHVLQMQSLPDGLNHAYFALGRHTRLIGPLTASSGEFTTLALRNRPGTRLFGQPTFGVPTGNETKQLSDGAVLFLTVCLGADRTGERFAGPIPPDEEVPPDWACFGTERDPVIARAIGWLETMIAR